MKTLMLLRHAKSAWSNPALGDHDRPLNERGRKAAVRMGRYMAEEGLTPDLVCSSTSARTRETWRRLSAAAAFDHAPRFERSLYLGEPRDYLKILHALPDHVGRVLMLGHSPGIETLARALAGDGDRADMAALAGSYPTGALTGIVFDDGWSGVQPGCGRLERFVRPRLLD